jgi:CxxC motif-containing protein
MVCITCPNGCHLTIEGEGESLKVTGNRCPRGEAFAKQEVLHPMRTICSTVRTTDPDCPVIPVRVDREIPKEKIFDVMREINRILVKETRVRGDVLVTNIAGTEANLIVTSDRMRKGD